MRNVVLFIAMSLDGYIADREGGVQWLGGDGSDPDNAGSYPRFYETVDAIVLGYNTYHQVATELFPDKWFYAGKQSYVLTHRTEPSTDDIIFTDEPTCALVTRLKAQEGKDIWICGGASIIHPLIDRGLIDRYHITVIPTLLGGGVRLFSEHKHSALLRLVSTEHYNGMVDLIYEKRKDAIL